ncbi:hypothetical protein [Actinotalea sp. Marseille-Q4924]|uniref:hypothetical protein n=1 Tax=Actinotalea sp. Marseille-Q4924 TaxID=2866571 RepID=UPI001CE3FA15|nr:hypothetical protein [Actinotalea sp. Marseille-Q4924]
MHPALLYDATVRDQQHRLALEARRHEVARRTGVTAPAGRRVPSAARTVLVRARRAVRTPSAPAGAPVQRPAATARPAADGHALAA